MELTQGKTIACLIIGLFIGDWTNLIEMSIVKEVFRRFGKILNQLFDKLCLIFDKKAIIFGLLCS